MRDAQPPILTTIIATLGPASCEVDTIIKLIHEGARIFRLNYSHGDFDEFSSLIQNIRKAEKATETVVGVLGDLPGPKIRIRGIGENEAVVLQVGDRVEFASQPCDSEIHEASEGQPRTILLSTTYPDLASDVSPGHRVLIDDGAVRLLAIERGGPEDDPRLICHVTVGGEVKPSKGVNLPDSELNVSSITPRDWECVDWSLGAGVDFLALSFVRRADDMEELKAYLAERQQQRGGPMPIIAKIEKPQALDDLDRILEVCDGVMVARGDLGVEMELVEVPLIQKRIIRRAHDYGVPVIVATQMLQSMIGSSTPTRAEVSDVANAIFDGADAVMLSGETAVGQHPERVVHYMARIAMATQSELHGALAREINKPQLVQNSRYRTAALARGLADIVTDLDAKVVVTWSEFGGGARYLSKNRYHVPIIAASNSEIGLRRMTLFFGVVPTRMEMPESTAEFVQKIDAYLLEKNVAEPGDPIVIVAGEPLTQVGLTNKIRIHYLGESDG